MLSTEFLEFGKKEMVDKNEIISIQQLLMTFYFENRNFWYETWNFYADSIRCLVKLVLHQAGINIFKKLHQSD